MTVQDFMNKYNRKPAPFNHPLLRPRIVCNDGYNLSVQASYYHYCTPRIDCLKKYDTVEVGFISDTTPEFFEYTAGGGVYGNVPMAVVQEVIDKHGGIKEADFSNDPYGKWKKLLTPMTPEEFKDAMLELTDLDEEAGHSEMDDLIIKLLYSLGYEDGAEIFEDFPKWYS